jgi:hypothetical protein
VVEAEVVEVVEVMEAEVVVEVNASKHTRRTERPVRERSNTLGSEPRSSGLR